ncbi:hypothetical protein HYS03_00920 [Candidatus Woesebacteria bacterium]|nr:hypothetical protein [Candidatus Woesebacteria bacterium]QQG47219.1 MAG: hypothetical protein HY044_03730 [Candidatus Woesebacteria bacterium]
MADPVSPKLQKLNNDMNAPMKEESSESEEGSLWGQSEVLKKVAKEGRGGQPVSQSAGVRSEAKPKVSQRVAQDPGLSSITPDTVQNPNAGIGKGPRTEAWGKGYGNS